MEQKLLEKVLQDFLIAKMERRDSIKGRFNVIIVRSGYVDECWQRKGK